MDAVDIQYALKRAGITQRAIAEKADVTDAMVSYVIQRSRVSIRIARLIAKSLKLKLEQVFPEYKIRKRNPIKKRLSVSR